MLISSIGHVHLTKERDKRFMRFGPTKHFTVVKQRRLWSTFSFNALILPLFGTAFTFKMYKIYLPCRTQLQTKRWGHLHNGKNGQLSSLQLPGTYGWRQTEGYLTTSQYRKECWKSNALTQSSYGQTDAGKRNAERPSRSGQML
jgi:hypothetical protein